MFSYNLHNFLHPVMLFAALFFRTSNLTILCHFWLNISNAKSEKKKRKEKKFKPTYLDAVLQISLV